MVSVDSKTQTFTNGTPNDAGPVDSEFTAAFNNDATLATAVTAIENGNIVTGTTLTINSAYVGGSPGNMAFMVERGTLPNTGFRWDETNDRWESTADGTNYRPINYTASSAPAITVDGAMYYDTALRSWRYYNAGTSAWQTLATGGSPKGFMSALAPSYQSASTVRIPSGFRCRDDGDAVDIVAGSNLDVVLSGSGALGLDTGSEASGTWYYLWIIRKSSDATVSAIFSASNSSPTLPSGYDQKRLLPIAFRNDGSSNLLDFYVADGWPYRPRIMYRVSGTQFTTSISSPSVTTGATNVLSNGTDNAYTDVSLAAYVPPLSRVASLKAITSAAGAINLREDGTTYDPQLQLWSSTSSPNTYTNYGPFDLTTSTSQVIEYSREVASGSAYLDVYGYVVTEYTNGL